MAGCIDSSGYPCRVGGNFIAHLASEQPDTYQVRLASILQASEFVISKNTAVKFNPRRIPVFVMLVLVEAWDSYCSYHFFNPLLSGRPKG